MNTLFKHTVMVVFLFAAAFSCKKDAICNATKANAGPDVLDIVGTSTTLAANIITHGVGSWTIESGSGGHIDDPLNPTATFTGTAGATYTLRWTVTGCPISTDDVQISFTSDPAILSIDKTDVINGDIVKFTGINFASNYNGGSQVVVATSGGPDIYLPILSRTESEIYAVVYSLATGIYSVKYSNKPDANAPTFFPSTVTYTVAIQSGFYTSQTFGSNSVTIGGTATFGIANGSTTPGDYTCALLGYDYDTGVMTEYSTTVSAIDPGGFGTMDKVTINIPGVIPAGAYHVKITYGSTTRIAGWGDSLNAN